MALAVVSITYTPLYNLQRELGATFAKKHNGWQLPVQYTDTIEEHNAVRSDVGIADLSYLGILKLMGDDRAKYLHRLISNDVEGLSVGEGNYATLLTNRGKIIADLRVYNLKDEILVSTAPENCEVAYAELDKYIIADDVELSIENENIGVIAVYGPNSAELVSPFFNAEDLTSLPEYHSIVGEVNSEKIVCMKSHAVGECGFHLYVNTDVLAGLWEKLIASRSHVLPIGWNALESLRIEAGTPRYGTELTDAVIPLEAELEDAIDFEKGCYIGQEIVARMKYRGHPNRLLRGLVVESEHPLQQNSRIFNGEKDVGWVTSSTFSPTIGKPIALCYVRMAVTDEGSQVQIESSDGLLNGTVVELPFI